MKTGLDYRFLPETKETILFGVSELKMIYFISKKKYIYRESIVMQLLNVIQNPCRCAKDGEAVSLRGVNERRKIIMIRGERCGGLKCDKKYGGNSGVAQLKRISRIPDEYSGQVGTL